MPKYNESRCMNTTRNSQNFLNNRNWPNSALTLVFRRILTKDNSSLHLMRTDLTMWKHHVESTLKLEMRKHLVWEGGFVETRRSAQSWMRRSAIIRDVAVLRSRSNLYFETDEQFLGFESWTESTNTWLKRHKKLPGNLSRRLNHNRRRL